MAGGLDMQGELAALSSNSFHQTVDSATHESLAFNPQNAEETSRAIIDLINTVR